MELFALLQRRPRHVNLGLDLGEERLGERRADPVLEGVVLAVKRVYGVRWDGYRALVRASHLLHARGLRLLRLCVWARVRGVRRLQKGDVVEPQGTALDVLAHGVHGVLECGLDGLDALLGGRVVGLLHVLGVAAPQDRGRAREEAPTEDGLDRLVVPVSPGVARDLGLGVGPPHPARGRMRGEDLLEQRSTLGNPARLGVGEDHLPCVQIVAVGLNSSARAIQLGGADGREGRRRGKRYGLRGDGINIRGVRHDLLGGPRFPPFSPGGIPGFENLGIVRRRGIDRRRSFEHLLHLGGSGVRGSALIDGRLHGGGVFALGGGGSDSGLGTAALFRAPRLFQSRHELILDTLGAQPALLQQLLELGHAQAFQQPVLDERLHHRASIPPVRDDLVKRH